MPVWHLHAPCHFTGDTAGHELLVCLAVNPEGPTRRQQRPRSNTAPPLPTQPDEVDADLHHLQRALTNYQKCTPVRVRP